MSSPARDRTDFGCDAIRTEKLVLSGAGGKLRKKQFLKNCAGRRSPTAIKMKIHQDISNISNDFAESRSDEPFHYRVTGRSQKRRRQKCLARSRDMSVHNGTLH